MSAGVGVGAGSDIGESAGVGVGDGASGGSAVDEVESALSVGDVIGFDGICLGIDGGVSCGAA